MGIAVASSTSLRFDTLGKGEDSGSKAGSSDELRTVEAIRCFGDAIGDDREAFLLVGESIVLEIWYERREARVSFEAWRASWGRRAGGLQE